MAIVPTANVKDTAAADPGAVKTEDAVTIELTVTTGAALPQVITAALRVAHACRCSTQFIWRDKYVQVSTNDTYQGVQRKVQRLLNPDKAKK